MWVENLFNSVDAGRFAKVGPQRFILFIVISYFYFVFVFEYNIDGSNC